MTLLNAAREQQGLFAASFIADEGFYWKCFTNFLFNQTCVLVCQQAVQDSFNDLRYAIDILLITTLVGKPLRMMVNRPEAFEMLGYRLKTPTIPSYANFKHNED